MQPSELFDFMWLPNSHSYYLSDLDLKDVFDATQIVTYISNSSGVLPGSNFRHSLVSCQRRQNPVKS